MRCLGWVILTVILAGCTNQKPPVVPTVFGKPRVPINQNTPDIPPLLVTPQQ